MDSVSAGATPGRTLSFQLISTFVEHNI